MNKITRKLLESAADRYLQALTFFIPFAAVMMALFALYRVEIFSLMKGIHAGLRPLSFWQYLGISLHFDAALLLVFLSMLLVLFMITEEGITGIIVAAAGVFTTGVSLLMGIEFFRVYETTFQTTYWTDENATGISEMVYSYFSEASAGFYIKSILLLVLLGLMAFIFIKVSRFRIIDNALLPGRMNPLKAILLSFVPFTALMLVSFLVFTGSSASLDSLARKDGKVDQRLRATIYEASMHPVYNFFSDIDDRVPERVAGGEVHHAASGPFRFGFDTRSPSIKRQYPRIHAIPRDKKYNIIFYFFESTPKRYIDYRVKGKYVMPTWRRLMKNAVIAENHYANFPLSANAMLSILTSAYDYPGKKLIIQKHSSIRLTSLPEILKKRGYRTCLVHTGDLRYAGQLRFLGYRDFDRIIHYPELKDIPPYNYKVGWGVDERAMTGPTVKYLKKTSKRPFFAVYMPVNPHHPYAIPNESFRITGKISAGTPTKEKTRLNYLNSLHYADAALGSLIDTLQKEGLMKNTLLFLFADHGEAFYEHVMNYNHPFFLYEENVNVPLLIYNREIITEPVHYRGITRHIDLMPTVLDLLQIPPPEEAEGISFLAPHRQQFALLHTHWKDDYMAIRDGNWKFIRDMQRGFEELYELAADPNEKNNLVKTDKDKAEKYRKILFTARSYKKEYYRRVLARGGKKKETAVKTVSSRNTLSRDNAVKKN